MGGTAASRLTTAISNVDGTTLGAAGGDQRSQLHTHVLTDTGHTHSITDPTHTHTNTVSVDGTHEHTFDYTYLIAGDVLRGSTGGYQLSTFKVNTNTAGGHQHVVTIAANSTGITATNATAANVVANSITAANYGAGNSQNIPPAIVMNYIIKT
jgi:hypothetical protein